MKKINFIKFICIFLLLVMLISYDATRSSTLYGLNLWLYNVIPVLFPYLLIINIIMLFDAFTILSFILYPILHPIFKISKNACFCIIVGFFCGFPVGIKTVNDMVKSKKITAEEGNYLACFCNNLSPSFYLNFIINDNIHKNSQFYEVVNYKILNVLIILLPYLSAIICSFIYRITNTKHKDNIITLCKLNKEIENNTAPKLTGGILNKCITDTFEALFKIGAYVITFSILTGLIINFFEFSENTRPIITTLLEISNGAVVFSECSLKKMITILLPLCSFGGLSALFQSIQMISTKELSKKNYIKYRLIGTGITYILSTILCLCFSIK